MKSKNMNNPLSTNKYEYDLNPVFPLDLFPSAIIEIIKGLNEKAGYNIDYSAASFLFAAAVAMGRTYEAEINNGWKEAPIIYLALVGNAGVGKSHPLSFAVKPLHDKDAIAYLEYKNQKLLFDEVELLSKSERNKHPGKVFKKPVFSKFLLSDYTPEAMAAKHGDNLRGIGIFVDELAGWFKNFNRYNSGSEQEFWLSLFSGKPINIDRKSSEPIFIKHPFVCVAGTIQPSILSKLALHDRNENGFLDRILFVAPDVKKEAWREEGIPLELKNKTLAIINKLTEMHLINGSESNTISFTDDAKKILFEWQKGSVSLCNEDEMYASIGAKAEIYVVRLALIIRGLKYGANEGSMEHIDIDDTKAAIALISYFVDTAIKIRKAIIGDPLILLTTNRKELFNALPDQFETKDGVLIAKSLGLSERTAKRFFLDKGLFTRVSHGRYNKNIF